MKQSSNELFWQNAFHAGVVAVVMIAVTIASDLIKWPWWLILLLDIYFGWILADNLFATIGLRKADVQSREGILSLRESMRESTTFSKRKRIIIQTFALIILVAIFFYLFFDDRTLFVSTLIGCIIGSIVSQRTVKRVKKRYGELNEEIDELLKEE